MGKKKSVLRKSMFGGFKKADVLNYIESLQQENVNMRREINDCAVFKRNFEALSSAKAQADKELAFLKQENDSLKARNVDLVGANAACNMKIEEMKVEVAETEKALKECESKIDEYENRIVDFENSYSKIREAEKIVEDAKVTASKIVDDAKKSVNNAKAEIFSATDRIKTACVNYDSASESLKSSIRNLMAALDAAAEKTNGTETEDA